MKYISRNIDKTLEDWKESTTHKPLLLRGARQVGKSSAVRHLVSCGNGYGGTTCNAP